MVTSACCSPIPDRRRTTRALKLIRYYWNLKGKPEKKIHLSRDMAYHGVTMAAASLSGLTPMHPQFDLPLPGFEKVPAPYWYGAKAAGYGDIAPEEFGALIAQKLEEQHPRDRARSRRVVLGRAGAGRGRSDLPAGELLARRCRSICAKYDVLLHADEVITGFGRTGEWFGSQTYGIVPDIIDHGEGTVVRLSADLGDLARARAWATSSPTRMRSWCTATPIPAIRWRARWR